MKRLLFCVIALMIIGCNKIEDSNIPYYPVYVEVDLSFRDKILTGSLSYKEFISTDKQLLAKEYVGYAGVLVVNGIGSYYAYDLCCPYESKKNITIKANDNGTAECTSCGSIYDIAYGRGEPQNGPSKSTLRRYNVSSTGSGLIVTN